jgi:hypothetical protein
MRRTLFFLLLLAGIGTGLGFFVEAKRASSLSAQLAESQQRLKLSDEQVIAKTQAVRELEQKNKILVAESEGLRGKLKTAKAEQSAAPSLTGTATGGDGEKTDFGGQMAKMMKDPAFKGMVKPQVEAQMRKLYGSLLKKLNLPPDTEKKFLDLMVEHSLAAMDMGGNVYSGDKAKLDQSAQDFKDKTAERDRQIAELLGPDGAAQFKNYEKTLQDQMALGQLRDKLSGVDALQPQQGDALLQIMTEERAKSPPSKIGNQSDPAGAIEELGSPEALDKFVASQTDLNSRVALRAASVLTPSQYKQFVDFQKQQIEMQKFGIQMARQLFNSKKDSGNGP